MMFEFQFEENFEPSSNTKEWWLYSHKTQHTVAGVRLPGLFATTYYEWQILGFVAVFLLEGVATYWAFREGVIVTAILASIFFDLVLAIVAHVYQKTICRLSNESVYSDDRTAGAVRRQLNRTLLKQRVFYFLILISGTFKVYWFLSVYAVLDATTLFIITCYMLGAVLHITCTGYAVFTFLFNRKINKEHNRYLDSKAEDFSFNAAEPISTPLEATVDLIPIEVGRHKLESTNDGYYLRTFGVLTDAELQQFIGRQHTPVQKQTVAVAGVRHQVETILKQDPVPQMPRPKTPATKTPVPKTPVSGIAISRSSIARH